jgi:hypothetical protein
MKASGDAEAKASGVNVDPGDPRPEVPERNVSERVVKKCLHEFHLASDFSPL